MSEQSRENIGEEFKRIDDVDDQDTAEHAAKSEYIARESHKDRSLAATYRRKASLATGEEDKEDADMMVRLFGESADESAEEIEKRAAEDYDFAQNMRAKYEGMSIEALNTEFVRLEREKKRTSLLQNVIREVMEAYEAPDDRV